MFRRKRKDRVRNNYSRLRRLNVGSRNDETKLRLRPWLEAIIDSNTILGLKWVNEERTKFRIPWVHSGKQDWTPECAQVFMEWAKNTGRYREGIDQQDYVKWKTRLRCAFNKAADIVEVKSERSTNPSNSFRVYQLKPRISSAGEDLVVEASSSAGIFDCDPSSSCIFSDIGSSIASETEGAVVSTPPLPAVLDEYEDENEEAASSGNLATVDNSFDIMELLRSKSWDNSDLKLLESSMGASNVLLTSYSPQSTCNVVHLPSNWSPFPQLILSGASLSFNGQPLQECVDGSNQIMDPFANFQQDAGCDSMLELAVSVAVGSNVTNAASTSPIAAWHPDTVRSHADCLSSDNTLELKVYYSDQQIGHPITEFNVCLIFHDRAIAVANIDDNAPEAIKAVMMHKSRHLVQLPECETLRKVGNELLKQGLLDGLLVWSDDSGDIYAYRFCRCAVYYTTDASTNKEPVKIPFKYAKATKIFDYCGEFSRRLNSFKRKEEGAVLPSAVVHLLFGQSVVNGELGIGVLIRATVCSKRASSDISQV